MTLKDAIGNPTLRDLRLFAGLQCPFLCFLIWSFHRGGWPAWGTWVAAGTASLAVVGLVRPERIRPFYTLWMVAVFPIGWTVSHLALAIVYYLVVTPVGLLRRAISGDPLQRTFDRDASTYWRPRRTTTDPGRYFRQF